MRFERLELDNFACYYREHAIDLFCTEERPVIIVIGGTGFGKTAMFDAINWALYGREYERDLPRVRHRAILDYVNESALKDAEKDGNFIEMSCTLYFSHEGSHYYISQSLAAKPYRNQGGALKAEESDRTTALYEIMASGNHKEIKYDSLFLDEILPNNVKDYFLFDGDRIYNLSQPGSSQEVRDAIFRVVDLELLTNARDHLTQIANDYRRAAARESKGDLSDVEKKYDEKYRRLEKLREQIRTIREERVAIESQLLALEEKLKNTPDSSQLQGRRSELAKRGKLIERHLEQAHASLRSWVATAGLCLAQDPALALMNVLDSKRRKGEIPKAVSQTLLRDLLKLNRCICGSEFKEGDPIQVALSDRLAAELEKPNDQALLDLMISLGKASALIEESIKSVDSEDAKLNQLREEKREIGLAIDQIDSELDKLPKFDVARLITEVRERRNALIANESKTNKTQAKIGDCDKAIRQLDKERMELAKKQKQVQKLQLREHLANMSAEKLETIYDVFAEDSREAVEKLTVQEFNYFVRSASGYAVALSQNYELEVLDSTGNRALQRLSMGQSQCLSLSFITAISRVSEKHPPLVIDMPFGRLDQSVHDAISTRLPTITSQLILFLIPGVEWNDTTEKNLVPKCSHIYNLEFDDSYRHTTIQEVDS